MRRTFTARPKSSTHKKVVKPKDIHSSPRSPKKEIDNLEEKIATNCSEMKAKNDREITKKTSTEIYL